MKRTVRILVTATLILTLVCFIGASDSADFMSPYGFVQVNVDGTRILYLDNGTCMILYPDGSIVRQAPYTSETTVTTTARIGPPTAPTAEVQLSMPIAVTLSKRAVSSTTMTPGATSPASSTLTDLLRVYLI